MKKLRDFIEKIAMKPALTALVVFIFLTVLIVGITYFKYHYEGDIFKNILVEAHGMLFDILIIGVLIFILQRLGEKRLKRELDIKR